jgi:Flp pilus assembly protein TadG
VTDKSMWRPIFESLRRLARGDSGSAAVLVAISLVPIFGMMGLAIDVGQLRFAKQRLQMTADAAALAGALELGTCGATADCSALETAAQNALTENGFTGSTLQASCIPSGTGLAISVNNGPCALGSQNPHNGNTKYVEAVVSQSQPTYFAGVIGVNTVQIMARAEAALGNSSTCMFTLNPTAPWAWLLNGSTLTSQCGIMDNSSSGQALLVNGSTLIAPAINIHGGYLANGSTVTGSVRTNVPASPDPLGSIPKPAVGGCTYANNVLVTSNITLNPGTYCGGITLMGGNLTFNPGVYILTNTLLINGGSVTGNGVTFYLTQNGSALFNGAYSVNLVAPTSGTYAGILLFQDPSDTNQAIVNGNATAVFQGSLYFPGAQLILNGSNIAAYTIIDANTVTINGSYAVNDDYSSLPGGSPIQGTSAVLVE